MRNAINKNNRAHIYIPGIKGSSKRGQIAEEIHAAGTHHQYGTPGLYLARNGNGGPRRICETGWPPHYREKCEAATGSTRIIGPFFFSTGPNLFKKSRGRVSHCDLLICNGLDRHRLSFRWICVKI